MSLPFRRQHRYATEVTGRRRSAWQKVTSRTTLVAILSVGIVLALGGQLAAGSSGPLITGVAGVDTYESAAFEHIRATGARLIQIPINWGSIASRRPPAVWNPEDPADPGYDWTSSDAAVRGAVEAKLTPVVLVVGAPKWAQRCQVPDVVRGEALGGALCDPDPIALAGFATAAARRYSGDFQGLPRVRYWQGLTEPNLSLSYFPQWRGGKAASAALYRKLINSFYFAVKSVNRSNLVLAGGLGPIAVPHLTIGPMRFARELLCMKGRRDPRPMRGNCYGGVHFDIFDIHPYTTGGPTHKGHADDVELGDLGKLSELIRAADAAGRVKGRFRHTPLWTTEFSWDSKPPDPGGLPMRILKRWTAEALYRAWSAGVSHFFWYGLRDDPPNPSLPFSETYQFGLYFRGATVAEDRPKPNMYAFRFPFVAYSRRSGFFFWGRTPSSERCKVRLQIHKNRRWRNATVTHADKNGIFEGVARTNYGRHKHGTVRALCRGEKSVPFSLHPVRDFHQAPFGNPSGTRRHPHSRRGHK